MTIEKAIEDLTAAIKEQTSVFATLAAAQLKMTPQVSGPGTPAEVVINPGDVAAAEAPKREAKREAKRETTPAPEPKQEPKQEAKQEAKQEPKQEAKREPEAAEVVLDESYYQANVRPTLIALAKYDITQLKKLLAEFGVEKGDQIPSAQWADAVEKAKAIMSV
jgi:hypothetical protein